MKNKIFSICTLFLIIFSTATCKKENTLEMELAKLPPATQTGQNTFGCLVNGKEWVAQNKDCAIFCDPNFRMYYDYSGGGSLSLIAYIKDSKKNIDEEFIISFDSTNFKLLHSFHNGGGIRFIFRNYRKTDICNTLKSTDSSTVTFGHILLSRYDLQKGIIAGTFEFTLYKPGCDTIKVTHGRFDKKL